MITTVTKCISRSWATTPVRQSTRTFAAVGTKKKKQKVAVQEENIGKDPHVQMIIRCLDAPYPPKPQLTDEQKEQHYNAGRNYVIGRFKQHNELYHDLACKIKMKQHAIKLLPEDEGTNWKEEALKIDEDPDSFPPLWRDIPTDYPPIPGFNPEEFVEEDR